MRRQNIEVPAGRIESAAREFTVVTETDLRTPEQFEHIVLREADGYPVRLGDVGHAALGPENERVNVRFNGREAVALGVVKQATANPLDVSEAVRAELPAIQQDLPEGLRTDLAYDSSIFIRESIDAVFETIAEAVVLVVLVIFFFLRSLRATLIPLVTIPVSLVGAFALMYAFGFSINTLTLLAMVLAVGLVVDDAIVMLENIHRHVEEGMAPFQAALVGAREIGFAVLAMTVTLASVYAPMAFMTGRTGRLFTEFALALAGAVLVSGFVALSLSPMMSSKMLRHVEKHGRLYRTIESGIVLLDQRLPPGARRHARGALARGAGRAAGRRLELLPVHHAEVGARADRGPRHHRRHRHRARRLDARVHRSLCEADRGSLSAGAGDQAVLRGHRLPRGEPGDLVLAPGRLGGARAQAAGGRGGAGPAHVRHSGADGVPGQSALARARARSRSRCSS